MGFGNSRFSLIGNKTGSLCHRICQMKISLLFYIFFFSLWTKGQFLPGKYRLVGQPEMAASFVFHPDSSFEFSYSNGAVDRMAKGRYSVLGNTLKLKSQKIPGKDFAIQRQMKKGKNFIIQVKDPNKVLMGQVLCLALVGNEKHPFHANPEGLIEIDLKKADKLLLQHSLYPDVFTLLKDESNPNNYFEVSLMPTLAEVSFLGIDFTIQDSSLTCLPNYFLPMPGIRFERE